MEVGSITIAFSKRPSGVQRSSGGGPAGCLCFCSRAICACAIAGKPLPGADGIYLDWGGHHEMVYAPVVIGRGGGCAWGEQVRVRGIASGPIYAA